MNTAIAPMPWTKKQAQAWAKVAISRMTQR